MQNYKSVLIVEDDEVLAQSLEKSFIRRGYETKIANNSREASENLKKFHPQYAVVDLKMPGESGLEFIKKLHDFDENTM